MTLRETDQVVGLLEGSGERLFHQDIHAGSRSWDVTAACSDVGTATEAASGNGCEDSSSSVEA